MSNKSFQYFFFLKCTNTWFLDRFRCDWNHLHHHLQPICCWNRVGGGGFIGCGRVGKLTISLSIRSEWVRERQREERIDECFHHFSHIRGRLFVSLVLAVCPKRPLLSGTARRHLLLSLRRVPFQDESFDVSQFLVQMVKASLGLLEFHVPPILPVLANDLTSDALQQHNTRTRSTQNIPLIGLLCPPHYNYNETVIRPQPHSRTAAAATALCGPYCPIIANDSHRFVS